MADAADLIANRAASAFGLRPPVLIRVGSAAVYRSGEVLLRVSPQGHSKTAQRSLVSALAAAGIPVALPLDMEEVIDGHHVTTWEWHDPVDRPLDGVELGRLTARLHEIKPTQLATAGRLPRWPALGMIDNAERLREIRDDDLLPPAQIDVLENTYNECQRWEERTTTRVVPCHGDLHPHNVVVTKRGPVFVDCETLCLAPACWDHAMLTTIVQWGGQPDLYKAFACGYGADFSADPGCRDLARLRLVTATVGLVMRARWDEHAAAQLRVRMRYWMGDPEAPTWSAV